MDTKIMTSFLLCFCLIASLSISQTASARLDSRQRFKRQNDEASTDAPADELTNAAITEALATEGAATVTAVLADGTTIVLPPGTTATIAANDATTDAAAQEAATTAADAVTAAEEAATTVADAVTAAEEAVTTVGDAATAAEEAVTTVGDAATAAEEAATATAAEEIATATADAATAAEEAATTVGESATATGEAATADTTGADGATDGAATVVDGNLETSTIINIDNDADALTSVKPEDDSTADGDNDTSIANVDTTSADGLADQTATVESITIDSNVTTIPDNETVTDAASVVTTISLDDIATGNDTIYTTTIDGIDADEEYADDSEERVPPVQTTTRLKTPVNYNNDVDAEEDDAIDDDVTTTTTAQQVTSKSTTPVADDIEYYDDPDEMPVISNIVTTTTTKPTTTVALSIIGDDVAYYDEQKEDDQNDRATQAVKSITTTSATVNQLIVHVLTTTASDNVDYYVDPDEVNVEQGGVTTTTAKTASSSTSVPVAQRIASGTSADTDDVEYYDDSDETDGNQGMLTTKTTTKTTSSSTSVPIAQPIASGPKIDSDDVEYYDDPDDINVEQTKTTTVTVKTTPKVTQRIANGVAEDVDDVEYYDEDEEDENEGAKGLVEPDGQKATTPSPVTPGPGGSVELRVVISPESLQVQYGQSYELTCSVYGADANTNIYWIQEEPERRYAEIDPPDANDKQVTMSQVSLRSRITIDNPNKIGRYTCMAQDAAGNSGSAVLTMQQGYPSYPQPGPPGIAPGQGGRGYLRIVAPDMAEGDYVEIQCEGASPEDEGRIQWFFNNRSIEASLVSDEQPLFPRGKTLHVRPISRAYLGSYRCSIPDSDYAAATSVVTFGGPSPDPSYPTYPGAGFAVSVAIVQGQTAQGQAQEGTQVILRCQPNEQASNYRWTFRSNQGTVDRGYSDQLVLSSATAQDSGVYTCEATSARGQTASGSVNLYVTGGRVTPISGRCRIDEATCRNGRCIPPSYLYDGKDDCGDGSDEASGSGDACQPSEIRCTNADRGRKCVQKFWMCDGDRDCDDGSDEDQRYCDLLPRQRFCKPSEFQCGGPNSTSPNPVCIPRSFQCDGYNDCPDRSDEVGCAKPTVVSTPQRQIHINAGETLSIRCVARGSPIPYINWRLNWGQVCGDGSGGGRCTLAQSIDSSDPSLVTGTLTVRNVNAADGGAYSCEALNNQGFIFAIPDAIAEIITDPRGPSSNVACNCNGHSYTCSPSGQCLNCQDHTTGNSCEFCAPGYQGDARRGTPYDCQPVIREAASSNCDPSGTHMERGGRCICKYNVEGDRCNQCKRSHFYLNPSTPNGCLPCFCSGVSTDCTSTDWRRQGNALPLNNWNAVPKNFATDRYEAGDRISRSNNGRELSLDQNSLGRSANEVLYWKAPKEALGDVVTLYDGTIDIHFNNDGQDDQAPSNDEFVWLRGNNIDIIHKLPQSQRFKANTNATYSLPVNERTFTRKDGTYIDRENILMALSDLDTLLIKINPVGGRRNAVLNGVTLNVAARDGYVIPAPTVESCRCPANYTGTSCEKCAEGYGRPHPLIGIYLGQCWSCRSLCHERSDRCDRETGQCFDCQGNSEGDRCERCRSGYVLDARINQCVREDQYQAGPSYPYAPGPRHTYYVDQRPYDPRGASPLNIILDGNQPEQRVPLQVLDAQPQSVVWGRTDGSPLPANVAQEGSDLVFHNPSAEQAGNYIATITHPDGSVERIAVYLEYRPGQAPSFSPSSGYPSFSPASPLTIAEGSNHIVQPQGAYYRVVWSRGRDQSLPSGVSQNANVLQISSARPDHSGTYYCEVYGVDGVPITVPYEVRVQAGERPQPSRGGPPRISIEPRVINLKEGQRMIVQYSVSSQDPIQVTWNRKTDRGSAPISSLFSVQDDRLILQRATPDAAGTYEVIVRNAQGEDRQELQINVEPRRGRGRAGQPAGAPQIRFQQDQLEVGYGEVVDVRPQISGAGEAVATWTKYGSTYLPAGVSANSDGSLRIEGRSSDIGGQYSLDVSNNYGRVSSPINVRWRESAPQYGSSNDGQDQSRSYIDVRFESRDEQSHQVGRDIYLQCSVSGSIERPYEYTFTKDGRPLAINVQVHPNGLLIIQNAQENDGGRYQCEVTFPRAPEVGARESSYDLRIEGGSAGGYQRNYQQGYQQDGYQQDGYQQEQGTIVEATIDPTEATLGLGETVNLTCHVKGADQYTVTWSKYAHDTSLPNYARQQGNSVIVAPTDEASGEQMYLQCSVNVPGQPNPSHAYAPVTIRSNDELHKKKKKKRQS